MSQHPLIPASSSFLRGAVEMVLCKTDMAIASRYCEYSPFRGIHLLIVSNSRYSGTNAAELVEDAAVRETIFSRIVSEHTRTTSAVLAVRQLPSLLADQPLLEQSVRSRSPYLDPLNHLQLELLRAYRGGQTDERTVRGIHLTINGLSHGLRST